MPKEPFSSYLYKAQGGQCYLAMTSECLALDRWLHPDQLLKGACSKRGWTWEHVIPRWVSRNIMGGVQLRLLACAKCNQAKGADLPAMAHLELALLHHEAYPMPGNARELIARFQKWRGDPAGFVEGVQPCDDADVPNTIEEALAQGGIGVGRTLHPRLPPAGYDKPLSQRIAEQAESDKRKNVQQEVRNLRLKADRAEIAMDHARAAQLRAAAWALIDAERRAQRDAASKAA